MTALYHAYTQTVADGTATSVVRPSDWNSAHVQGQTLSGNTAGVSSFTGTNIVFQGGNNVTLSGVTAAGAATIVVSGANTVAQTVQTQASGNIAGVGFTSTTTTGTAITASLGTDGLSMAVPQYITTYAAQTTQTQPAGNIAGVGFTSTSTAGTNITASLGTNGLSMAVPNYITTYVNDLTSGRAGTGTTLALTNLTGTLSVNTNGVALSLSAGAGGGGGGVQIADGASTVSNNTVVFSNANGVSFGLNGSTMTASIIANNTYDGWPPYADLPMVAGQQGQGTLYFEPEHCPYYFQDRVAIPVAYSNATNSTGSVTLSYWVGFYTQNVSTLSLASSTSFSTGLTFSGTVGSYSLYSGMRLLTFPWTLTVQEREIYIAQLSRTTTGGANASVSQMLVSQINSNFVGFFGASHNTTQQWTQGQGVYTATTSALPNSVAFSQIRGSDSNAMRAPAIMFVNGTV